jgi:cytochrome oxidase Cu insertion factor (SCO1/SenC/PrrC family)
MWREYFAADQIQPLALTACQDFVFWHPIRVTVVVVLALLVMALNLLFAYWRTNARSQKICLQNLPTLKYKDKQVDDGGA